MKIIGLLGGMSWESTALYYRAINQQIKARLGGHHSAKLLLRSVDFAEVEQLQRDDRWDDAGKLLGNHARALEDGGAECLLLCTNTMHRVASYIESVVNIPFLHIADATGLAIQAARFDRVGLLATRFTMEQEFYRSRLREKFGIEAVVPDEPDREAIHRVIYDELVHGIVRDDSRATYLDIVQRLEGKGVQGVILGCTEITMLLGPDVINLPCFDTTELHARQAVDFSLG
jgi:aspartate racemase